MPGKTALTYNQTPPLLDQLTFCFQPQLFYTSFCFSSNNNCRRCATTVVVVGFVFFAVFLLSVMYDKLCIEVNVIKICKSHHGIHRVQTVFFFVVVACNEFLCAIDSMTEHEHVLGRKESEMSERKKGVRGNTLEKKTIYRLKT